MLMNHFACLNCYNAVEATPGSYLKCICGASMIDITHEVHAVEYAGGRLPAVTSGVYYDITPEKEVELGRHTAPPL